MILQHRVQRVIVVVLDGLRADATHLFPLPNMATLAQRGAATFTARTVTPSVTAAAMTSLFTGVPPDVHGVVNERFAIPRTSHLLTPMTRALQRGGYPSAAFLAAMPRAYRTLAGRIARGLGMERVSFTGDRAGEILAAAREYLNHQRRGLIFLHWPDADRAGHSYGWNSPEYARRARQLDAALGELVQFTDVLRDPETLLIICADHGGGGMDPRNHNSLHPLDQRIPLLLLGGSVRCVELPAACSLLDVPATVCWVLGVTPPASYAGRPLTHAFSGPDERVSGAMAAVA